MATPVIELECFLALSESLPLGLSAIDIDSVDLAIANATELLDMLTDLLAVVEAMEDAQ
ncbi:MAG TPA: hypothetical protein PKN91_11295 [Steroidobacteraceae bacterium]|nr:hypothetical protein [Steroidobacteraceae bacterium]